MGRIHNFNAGPAALPRPVLEQARDELLDLGGGGMSVMEISHRSKTFDAVIQSAEAGMRKLLGAGPDYAVLFLQGGASTQFATIPMNLLNGGTADYIDTGTWSSKAIKEAKLFGKVNVAWSGKEGKYVRIPKPSELKLTPDARYLHLTSNNTIAGTQYKSFPKSAAPMIADMSSDILSRAFDINQFAMIYAGAQKNIGPSGLALVVMRKDLAEQAAETVPTMFKYSTHIAESSLYNTPNTWAIYIVNLVCQWLEKLGGVAGMEKINNQKASALYGMIDKHGGFYTCPVEQESRSSMNVVWRLPSEELEAKFLGEAKKQGMEGLKGHRSVGGIRASIYNAVGLDSVQALAQFMDNFAKANG